MKVRATNYLLSVIVAPVMLATNSFAAPVINNVTGSLTNGQTLTISGTGFGVKAVTKPVYWDTVDNVSLYNNLANGATIPTKEGSWVDRTAINSSSPWQYNSSQDMGTSNGVFALTTTEGRNGSKGYKSKGSSGTATKQATLEGLNFTPTGKVYMSWWWKPSSDPGAGVWSGNMGKYMRFAKASDQANYTSSWSTHGFMVYVGSTGYCSSTPNGGFDATWLDFGKVNDWNFHEAWIDSTNRTMSLKINGKSVVNGGSWSQCAAFNFDQVWKVGWDGGGTAPLAITTWMDDVYVDNTFSRVMICDNANYSNVTKCEMQPPINIWNDNQIQVTVNQGSFANNSTGYLYVVDSNGNVSTSKQISFGSSGGNTAITPPTGLKVVN